MEKYQDVPEDLYYCACIIFGNRFNRFSNTAPKIGSIQKYTADFNVSEWVVDDMNTETSYYLQHKDEHSITIKMKDDYRMVGSTINIIAKGSDGSYAQLTAMMSKKF